jgi:hypothetical protein
MISFVQLKDENGATNTYAIGMVHASFLYPHYCSQIKAKAYEICSNETHIGRSGNLELS